MLLHIFLYILVCNFEAAGNNLTMCIATECASVLCLFTAFFSFCYVEEERYIFFATFILHSRESDVSLCFGQQVRTCFGVAISGSPVFHMKVGCRVPLSALPKDTTSELAGLFSTTSHKCQAPSREAIDTIF